MGQIFIECDGIRAAVSESLDGELSQVEAARVRTHLAGCSACRAYAAGIDHTARLVRDAPLEQLGFDVVLPNRRLALARRLQVAAAAAALVVTVGVSAVVGSVGGGSSVGASSATAVAGNAQPAKLRFTEQELRMLYRASSARGALRMHGRMTL
jgi:predicted anti-sigma-YlaC factor YlaD